MSRPEHQTFKTGIQVTIQFNLQITDDLNIGLNCSVFSSWLEYRTECMYLNIRLVRYLGVYVRAPKKGPKQEPKSVTPTSGINPNIHQVLPFLALSFCYFALSFWRSRPARYLGTLCTGIFSSSLLCSVPANIHMMWLKHHKRSQFLIYETCIPWTAMLRRTNFTHCAIGILFIGGVS